MKFFGDENITIFLNNYYIKNLDMNNKENIEKFIKQISEKYNIKLFGYYDVQIYYDKNYGIIIKIKKEELEYIDYFNQSFGMNIEIIENSFLYKIEDILPMKNIENKYIIRKLQDSFYIELKVPSSIDFGIILENSEIIYGDEADRIINKGNIIKPEVIQWKNP